MGEAHIREMSGILISVSLSPEIYNEVEMEIVKNDIDSGAGFDWGRTSEDYAKFRDIYPEI